MTNLHHPITKTLTEEINIARGSLSDKEESHGSHITKALELFDKMLAKAEDCPEYDKKLASWLDGSCENTTLLIRELSSPWGDFWNDRNYFNEVHAIDSAQPQHVLAIKAWDELWHKQDKERPALNDQVCEILGEEGFDALYDDSNFYPHPTFETLEFIVANKKLPEKNLPSALR